MQKFNVGDKVQFSMQGANDVVYTGVVTKDEGNDMYLVALDQQEGFEISMGAARLSLVE